MAATLVFDFDSTLIDNETLEILAEEALRGAPNAAEILARVQDLTNKGMNGEIPLEQGFRERFALLSLTRAHVDAVTARLQQRLSPSVQAHAVFFKENAEHIYVVSGGFRECMLPTTRTLGIPDSHVFGNVFLYDEQGQVLGLDTRIPTSHSGGKRDIVASIVATTPAVHPVVMIGDGMSDARAKGEGAADLFWAYTEIVSRRPVVAVADAVCDTMEEVIAMLRKN